MNATTPDDDEHVVDAIYDQVSSDPADDQQRAFCLVWDAATLIGCGGFESLFDQSPNIEEYAAAFATVGMPDAAALFHELLANIPTELRADGQDQRLFEYLRSRFEELKVLSYRFYDVTADWPTQLLRYVHEHPNHFPGA